MRVEAGIWWGFLLLAVGCSSPPRPYACDTSTPLAPCPPGLRCYYSGDYDGNDEYTCMEPCDPEAETPCRVGECTAFAVTQPYAFDPPERVCDRSPGP